MAGKGRNNHEDVPFADGSIEEALRLCASFERPVSEGVAVAVFGSLPQGFADSVKKSAALLWQDKIEIFYSPGTFYEACRLLASLPSHAVCVTGNIDETGWLAAVLDQTGRKGVVLFFEPEQNLFLATAFGGGEFSTFPIIPEAYALPIAGHEKNKIRLLAGIIAWAGGQTDSIQAGADMARYIEQ